MICFKFIHTSGSLPIKPFFVFILKFKACCYVFFKRVKLTHSVTHSVSVSLAFIGLETICKWSKHIRLTNLCLSVSVALSLSLSPPPPGDHVLRHLGAVLPLRGLRRGGPPGGDQLGVPAPAADAAHGSAGVGHPLPGQQHRQPGHLRGVPHQHAGLDDALAGAEPGQRAPGLLHGGQRGHGHHDRHEHRALLSPAAQRLPEEQRSGGQEGEGDVRRRRRRMGRSRRRRWCRRDPVDSQT